MKVFSASLFVMLGISLIVFAQTANKNATSVEQELRNLVRMWDESYVKGDTSTLDRLLANEFAFVGGPTKAEYLASFKSRSTDLMIDSAVSTDLHVQVYGNAAVLTGLDTIAGKNKGQPFIIKWLYMDVWIKRNGRWECVKTYSSQAKN